MIRYLVPISSWKTSTNKFHGRAHWSKRKEFTDDVFEYAKAFCRPVERVVSYPVQIIYRFFFVTRPLDTLNCATMAKALEDAFRSLGILEEDDPSHVARTILEVFKLTPKKKKAAVYGVRPQVDTKNEDYVEIIIENYANNWKN